MRWSELNVSNLNINMHAVIQRLQVLIANACTQKVFSHTLMLSSLHHNKFWPWTGDDKKTKTKHFYGKQICKEEQEPSSGTHCWVCVFECLSVCVSPWR